MARGGLRCRPCFLELSVGGEILGGGGGGGLMDPIPHPMMWCTSSVLRGLVETRFPCV